MADINFNTATGVVQCTKCSSIWCNHIESYIKNNSDPDLIWAKNPDTKYIDFFYIEIPMFPTHELWTKVSLTLNETAPMPMYQVSWRYKDQDRFICNITEGEGRKVIRTCLLEYMYSDFDRKKACDSSTHGLTEEELWKAHQKGIEHYSEDWCVYLTGSCLACLGKFNPDSIAPDLIPDKQNAWS